MMKTIALDWAENIVNQFILEGLLTNSRYHKIDTATSQDKHKYVDKNAYNI